MVAAREQRLILCDATLVGGAMTIDADQLRSIVNASAKAGFAGVSLWGFHHLAAIADGMKPEEVRALHTDLGLSVPVVEALLGWESGDETAIDQQCLGTLDIARDYGAQTAAAVVMAPTIDFDAAARGLAHLASRAAERGLTISVEFLPWGGLPSIADAWRLLQASGRENTGLVLDTWHWIRQPGGPDVETLRSIPGERIHVVQLDDTTAVGSGEDLMTESMTTRLLPGDGEVDFAELFAALDAIGADPIWAPEVFNVELMALGPDEMAQKIGDASRKILRL